MNRSLWFSRVRTDPKTVSNQTKIWQRRTWKGKWVPEINIYAQKVPKVLVGTKSDLLQTEKKAEKEKKKKLQNVETDRTVKQKEVDSVQGSTHRSDPNGLTIPLFYGGVWILSSVFKDYGFHSFSTCSSINQVKTLSTKPKPISICFFSRIWKKFLTQR